MQPIHFQGMHCYHECVISIANCLGLTNYPAAFSTLWSETDFRFDAHREAFLTTRLITNLEALGAKVEGFDCFSPADADRYLSRLHIGEFAVVGADAFYVPWNQFYKTFHGPHYFILQCAATEMWRCFDPTYNKMDEQILYCEIAEHIFDISLITKVGTQPLHISVKSEAQEILRTHPHTREKLLSQIAACENETRENIILLAKYIDAMINNRYLYLHFLENHPQLNNKKIEFLRADDFLKWKSIKNGLYKAAVIKDKTTVADICGQLNCVIEKELSFAGGIIGYSGD